MLCTASALKRIGVRWTLQNAYRPAILSSFLFRSCFSPFSAFVLKYISVSDQSCLAPWQSDLTFWILLNSAILVPCYRFYLSFLLFSNFFFFIRLPIALFIAIFSLYFLLSCFLRMKKAAPNAPLIFHATFKHFIRFKHFSFSCLSLFPLSFIFAHYRILLLIVSTK